MAIAVSPDQARLRLYAVRKRHELAAQGASGPFTPYRFEPERYIREKLGWEPWAGSTDQPGQADILAAYGLALQQQHERDAYEAGGDPDHLRHWQPGQIIQNWLRIEAGHTVGKTKLASGVVNHFFDCFAPSIIYSFAPSKDQVHDLLWKEIKADRRGKALPGRILDLRLERADDHFAIGRATNNAGGTGTERIHGQHGKYLMFVVDEAEGVAQYVFTAIRSMTSGGICIVLLLANPRTRTSEFHKVRELPQVKSFRLSCVWHPNVLSGREMVPGAVRRDYVESMTVEHCTVVQQPDATAHTFSLPFDVRTGNGSLPAGTIFQPDPEMMFRVLGVAPANIADNTIVSLGSYEAACQRTPPALSPERPAPLPQRSARMGVDVARFGKDYGTLYVRHLGRIWRPKQFYHHDTTEYAIAIAEEALRLRDVGVTSLHVRIDGGGGFGGGVIDQLSRDMKLLSAFDDFRVLEVHFNGSPFDGEAYADLATEMYGQAAESIKGAAIVDAPANLEADLCERTYGWANRQGVAVKRLERKDDFKKRMGRSPDDGDGFVLATAPDFLFEREAVVTADRVNIGTLGLYDDEEDDYVHIGPAF